MDLDQMVAALDIHIVAMALGVAMLAAWQIGRHMGRRVRGMDGIKPSKFDDASIALLGLLLAFSFGTSIAKHDQRQLAVVADANAIGDFYTCATLLKEPSRTKLQTVITAIRTTTPRPGSRRPRPATSKKHCQSLAACTMR